MLRFWLSVTSAGLIGAAIYLLGHAGSVAGMMLSYLTPAPLFLAGLGFGAIGSTVAAAAGATVVLLFDGVLGALVFALIFGVPATLLSRQALLSRDDEGQEREWYTPGLLAAWLTLIGVAGLMALGLFLATDEAGVEGAVRAVTLQVAEMLRAPEPQLFAEVVTPLLPGSVIAAWMLMLTLNAALAQSILVGLRRNVRPSPDIAELELPGWIAPAGVVAALAGLVLAGDLGYLARNLVMVMALPFFLQGLALIHAFSRRSPSRRPLLAIFYGLLIVQGWLALPIAILGLIEQLAGFRGRMANSRES